MDNVGALTSVTLACSDPRLLGEFYRLATGWETIYDGDDAVYLSDGTGVRLGCERRAEFSPVPWNRGATPPARLDFGVASLVDAERRLTELGATRPGHDFDNDQWIFMADPVGHPFCVTIVF